jgi:hypothetical protein
MGIETTIVKKQPEITFNRVFLVGLEINQPITFNDSLQPRYDVMIQYRLYGVDPSGMRHFDGEIHEIQVTDFLTSAIMAAQTGDMDRLIAMQAIERAVASIISEEHNIEARVI